MARPFDATAPWGARLPALRARGFLIQDLAAVALGLKPMCRSGFTHRDDETWADLRAFAGAAGLALTVYESAYESAEPMFALTKSKTALAEYQAALEAKQAAVRGEDTARATREIGRLLGYPPCCVEAFSAHEGERSGAPYPAAVRERSGPGPYRWPANFLYNFHSRSAHGQAELRRLLSRGYRAMDAYVLPWIPCRFDCAASLAYADALLPALEAHDAAFYAGMCQLLSAPVLVFGEWGLVPLTDARREGQRLAYGAAVDLKTLAPAPALTLLAGGDALEPAGNGRWEVLAGGRARGTVSALLIEFSAA